MKKTQREAKSSAKQTRAIDSDRLAVVRGGSLGITVGSHIETSDFMSNQHNEALVAL
jgi:hypothetical protein